jgi:hypothetical protein
MEALSSKSRESECPAAATLVQRHIEGGTSVAAADFSSFATTAFLVAAFRFFVFAARLRADFSFRFRTAFFAADLLPLGIGGSYRDAVRLSVVLCLFGAGDCRGSISPLPGG